MTKVTPRAPKPVFVGNKEINDKLNEMLKRNEEISKI